MLQPQDDIDINYQHISTLAVWNNDCIFYLIENPFTPYQPLRPSITGNFVHRVYAYAAFIINPKAQQARKCVLKFGFDCHRFQNWWSYIVFFTGVGAVAVFLRTAANLYRATVSTERHAAFLLFIVGILAADMAYFNFGCGLFILVASTHRGFLRPLTPCVNGQAAFCFPAT